MNSRFSSIVSSKCHILLDGASGTHIQAYGMPTGVCPEIFVLDHPDPLKQLQGDYYKAGSDVVFSFTFGGNETKLSHYGISAGEVFDVNYRLVKLSCEVRDATAIETGRKLFVAGDMGPTGRFLEPAGDMSFAELRDVYARQAKALEAGGVDFYAVETMMDLMQTKAAVAGIRMVSELPIMVSMTFDKGRTLSGNTPEAALVSLRAVGADAFGANCSTGPEEMKEIIERAYAVASIPVIAKPNAGMPAIIDGKTVFPMGADEFGVKTAELFRAGAVMIGGCCGTGPEHISSLSREIDIAVADTFRMKDRDIDDSSYISSYCRILKYDDKCFARTSVPGSPDDLADIAADAEEEGADLLIFDFDGYGEPDEETMKEIKEAYAMTAMTATIPLGVSCASARLLEEVASVYPGRLLFAGEKSPAISDVAGRYGVKVV